MSNNFQGFSDINRPDLFESIRDNVISFIDWGMLNAGGFYNVRIPTSGAYGGDAHLLKPVNDPRYTAGRVWQGFRGNWVWEDGLATTSQPIAISGLYINNTFYPNGSGYYIDYPAGRVVFDRPVPPASSVKMEYSFKWINVTDAKNIPLLRRVQPESYRVDSGPSGIYEMLAESRIQLPTIAVETPITTNSKAYELGNRDQNISTDIVLHILAEDDTIASRLSGALVKQKENTIYMYDPYLVGQSGKFPLDYRGALTTNAMTYADLVKTNEEGGYRYIGGTHEGTMTVSNAYVSGSQWISQKLYHKPVRWTIATIAIIL